jgi:hypothetical protein
MKQKPFFTLILALYIVGIVVFAFLPNLGILGSIAKYNPQQIPEFGTFGLMAGLLGGVVVLFGMKKR